MGLRARASALGLSLSLPLPPSGLTRLGARCPPPPFLFLSALLYRPLPTHVNGEDPSHRHVIKMPARRGGGGGGPRRHSSSGRAIRRRREGKNTKEACQCCSSCSALLVLFIFYFCYLRSSSSLITFGGGREETWSRLSATLSPLHLVRDCGGVGGGIRVGFSTSCTQQRGEETG